MTRSNSRSAVLPFAIGFVVVVVAVAVGFVLRRSRSPEATPRGAGSIAERAGEDPARERGRPVDGNGSDALGPDAPQDVENTPVREGLADAGALAESRRAAGGREGPARDAEPAAAEDSADGRESAISNARARAAFAGGAPAGVEGVLHGAAPAAAGEPTDEELGYRRSEGPPANTGDRVFELSRLPDDPPIEE